MYHENPNNQKLQNILWLVVITIVLLITFISKTI
jgi:hypothetical protein